MRKMKKILIYVLLLLFSFGCHNTPGVLEDPNLVFTCNGTGDDIIFEGEMEGMPFCYTKSEGYSIRFLQRAEFVTESPELHLSDEDTISFHCDWTISESEYADYKHRVSVVSPALDSSIVYFLDRLEVGELEISNKTNPFFVEFSYNKVLGANGGSSRYGKQDAENFIRINYLNREKFGDSTRLTIEFEFNVKLYTISHNKGYFGQLKGHFTTEIVY